jgi:hypothetical protein
VQELFAPFFVGKFHPEMELGPDRIISFERVRAPNAEMRRVSAIGGRPDMNLAVEARSSFCFVTLNPN